MLIQPNSRFVMIGDSITDCGRVRPVALGRSGMMGNGYACIVDGMLHSTYPGHDLRIYNMGCGGDTVRHLDARWKTDVLDLKPDWLSIMIGINDVWRKFDCPQVPEMAVPIDEYEKVLNDLIIKTKPMLKGLILLTPYFLEPNVNDPMRHMMDDYGSVVKATAKKYKAICVDTQAVFDSVLKVLHPMMLAGDRIHVNPTGHSVIARELLKALEYTW